MFKISAYFITYNDSLILPHLLRYYTSFCNNVIICDNYSTDRTDEIVKQFKNVGILKFNTDNTHNEAITTDIKNNVWKQDVGKFDYVIVADADEFLCHPNIFTLLTEKRSEGYTIFRPHGYHMIGNPDLQLNESDNIFDKVKYGVRVTSMDKFIMFDCNRIKEIKLHGGSHDCNPIGYVKIYYNNDLKLKHFKFLGLKNHLESCRIFKERMSDFNKINHLADYYLENDEYHVIDYKKFYDQRVLVND